jgi:hypothetical protein
MSGYAEAGIQSPNHVPASKVTRERVHLRILQGF